MLKRLDIELNAQGIHVAFVELRSRLQDLILRYGLFETLDREHFYPSIPQRPRGDRRCGAGSHGRVAASVSRRSRRAAQA